MADTDVPRREMRMVKVKKRRRPKKVRPRKGESTVEARYRVLLKDEEKLLRTLTRTVEKLKDAQRRRRYYENKFEKERRENATRDVRRRVSLTEDV